MKANILIIIFRDYLKWETRDLLKSNFMNKIRFILLQVLFFVFSAFSVLFYGFIFHESRLQSSLIDFIAIYLGLTSAILINIIERIEKHDSLLHTPGGFDEKTIRVIKRNFYYKYLSLTSFSIAISIIIVPLCLITLNNRFENIEVIRPFQINIIDLLTNFNPKRIILILITFLTINYFRLIAKITLVYIHFISENSKNNNNPN